MGLKTDTIKGVVWAGFGTVSSGVIGFLITIILARYLTPEDFGLIEVILSIVVLSEVLVDCGLSKAIIRDKDVTQTDLSTMFYMNVGVAILLYLAIFICAPMIADFYSATTELVLLLRVLSLKILADAFSFTQVALCNRNMRFKELSIITTISMLLAGVVSIAFICGGLGVWALVIYYLALSLFKTILISLLMKWMPTFAFDVKRAKYFIGFGGPLMITQIIDKMVTSAESLLVGKVYSKADLGYFSQARKLDTLVIQTLLGIVQKVTYPALSQTKSADQLTSGYKEIMQVSLWAITPIACFTFFNAEVFMCAVFGPQWAASAVYLQLFSVFSLIFPLHSICYNVFLVLGETKRLLYISIFKQCLRVGVITLTISKGLYFFAVGIVIVMVVSSLVYIYYGGRLINYPVLRMLKDNINTIFCSVVSVGLAAIIISYCNISGYLEFVMLLSISILLYWLFNILFRNQVYRLILQILKQLKK